MTDITITKDTTKDVNLIPSISPNYVAHGCYDVIRKVISKNIFAPVWVSGESGNGKTYGVEQACAAEKRELVILNMSNETSEEDLIGSYILENENMYEIELSDEDYESYMKFKDL